MLLRAIPLAFALLATPALAQADDPLATAAAQLDAADLNRDRTTVALGVATVPAYEGADHNRLIPAALVQGTVDGYAFSTRGLHAYLDVLRNRPGPVWDVQFGPVVGLNLDRTRRRQIDDAQVEALGTRRTAIELGGFVGIGKTGVLTSPYDKLTASLSYTRDVNNAHDSYVWSPSLDYGTPLSTRAYVGLTASADYAGGKYADYYFSVTPAGALASGLPSFAAGKGWKDWSLGGFGSYALSGDLLHGLGLVAGVRYSRLLNDFARSPVVSVAGDRDGWSGTIGLAYTFKRGRTRIALAMRETPRRAARRATPGSSDDVALSLAVVSAYNPAIPGGALMRA